MKLLGPKRSKVFRWSVYTLTVLVLIGIPVSIWSPQRLRMQHTGESKVKNSLSFVLHGGQFNVYGGNVYHMYAKPSWNFYLVHKKYIRPNANTRWWLPPTAALTKSPSASMQVVTSLHARIPLVYTAPLLIGGSWWLRRRAKKKVAPGHCPTCNYNLAGLEWPTCPECGATNA